VSLDLKQAQHKVWSLVEAQMGRKQGKDGWTRLLAVLMILLVQPLTRTRLGMCVQSIDVMVSTVKRPTPTNSGRLSNFVSLT